MTRLIKPAPIRQTLEVQASPERAFDTFFLSMNDWSPREHSLSGGRRADLVVEPRAGGKWVETGENGAECLWGKVVEWDPPRRALLLWQIGSDFSYSPDVHTEIEVTFEEISPGRTRVNFEHRALEGLGADAEATRETLAGDDGWGGALVAYENLLRRDLA